MGARVDVVAEATRVRNRLHADLVVLPAGLSGIQARAAQLVGAHPLLALPGVGVLTAAKLIAETGDVRRFRSADAFAMLAGVASIPASSGQVQRMRLNSGGNRQLNRALHTIATSRLSITPGQGYLARKAAEHKSDRETFRALKRQIFRTVFRLLRDGADGLAMAA